MIKSFKKFLERNQIEDEERLKELEYKNKKSIHYAQVTNSPTYYDHISKSIETTPSMSNRKQSLSYIQKEIKI
jgi:hypothetical protein